MKYERRDRAAPDMIADRTEMKSRLRRHPSRWLAIAIAVLAVPITGGLAFAAPVGTTAPAVVGPSVHAPAATVGVSPSLSSGLSVPTQPLGTSFLPGGGVVTTLPLRGFSPSAFHNTPGHPSLASIAAARATARPSAGSSADNFLGDNCTFESTDAQVGGGVGSTYVASAIDITPLYNGTGGMPCTTGSAPTTFLETHGLSAAFRTTNNGGTWGLPQYLGQNATHWQSSTDPADLSIHNGEGYVTAGPGTHVAYADVWEVPCPLIAENCANATYSSPGIPNGIAVTISPDGGQTWAPSSQVFSENFYVNITSTACGGLSGYYYHDIVDRPTVAYNPSSGTLIAAWDMTWYKIDTVNCVYRLNQSVEYSVSTNGGASWSAAKNISRGASALAAIEFGPAPKYAASIIFDDFANASSANCGYLAFSNSTNNGTTWTTPRDVVGMCPVSSSTPDSFRVVTIPSLAADNWSSSPYKGNLYAVWSDNQTGSNQGYGAIAFTKSANGGFSFSTPVDVTNESTLSLTYFMPAVTVAPNGTVWVTYIGELNTANSQGTYREYGVYSSNGGTTWSRQFPISSVPSNPGSLISFLGAYSGVAASSTGALPVWSDCRINACGTSGIVQAYSAFVNELGVKSNAGNSVSVVVDDMGINLTVPAGSAFGADVGASLTVSAPESVPSNNTTYVWAFTGWSGDLSSTQPVATFTYSGSGAVVADYALVKASFITGTFSPHVAGALLTVDQKPVNLLPLNATAYQFNVSVASTLIHYINASAPAYVPFNTTGSPAPGTADHLTIVLSRAPGHITGHINPANATLTLNGTVLTVPATGAFSYAEPWGWYWLNATAAGRTSFHAYVHVTPGGTTPETINLIGGWIVGIVTPVRTGLTVRVDGVAVNVTVGNFNVSALGGLHVVTTTEPGFNTSSISVNVHPAASALVNISLTDFGHIAGSIGPGAALKAVILTFRTSSGGGTIGSINTISGAFNDTILAGNYELNVSASGYVSQQQAVSVGPGNTTVVGLITLTAVPPPKCTVNCGGGGNGGNGSSGGLSTTDLIIIVVAIIAVAIVAAALILRRPPRPAPAQQYDPGPTYDGTAPGELPKLQSDGSMESAPPPPPN